MTTFPGTRVCAKWHNCVNSKPKDYEAISLRRGTHSFTERKMIFQTHALKFLIETVTVEMYKECKVTSDNYCLQLVQAPSDYSTAERLLLNYVVGDRFKPPAPLRPDWSYDGVREMQTHPSLDLNTGGSPGHILLRARSIADSLADVSSHALQQGRPQKFCSGGETEAQMIYVAGGRNPRQALISQRWGGPKPWLSWGSPSGRRQPAKWV